LSLIGRDKQVRLHDECATQVEGIDGSQRVIFLATYRSSNYVGSDVTDLYSLMYIFQWEWARVGTVPRAAAQRQNADCSRDFGRACDEDNAQGFHFSLCYLVAMPNNSVEGISFGDSDSTENNLAKHWEF
jgi:hypothetical protein